MFRCLGTTIHLHGCLCTCEDVCVALCTLAVIIVSNNPNEERGTGCVQSSNYKLISYHVVWSN